MNARTFSVPLLAARWRPRGLSVHGCCGTAHLPQGRAQRRFGRFRELT